MTKRIIVSLATLLLLFVFVGCEQMVDSGNRRPEEPGGPGKPDGPSDPGGERAFMEVIETQEAAVATFHTDTDSEAPLARRLDTLAQLIAELPQVAEAEASLDVIEVSYESGLRGVLLFLQEGSEDGVIRVGPQGTIRPLAQASPMSESSTRFRTEVTQANPADDATKNVIGNNKVLICAPLDTYPGFPVIGEILSTYFEDAPQYSVLVSGHDGADVEIFAKPFDVEYKPARECTVEVLQDMSEYGTIVLYGHGIGGWYFALADLLGQDYGAYYRDHKALIDEDSLRVHSTIRLDLDNAIVGWHTSVAITNIFIDRYVGSMPNSVVFMLSCESAKSPRALANSFFTNRAGAFLGFDEMVSAGYGAAAMFGFFSTMLERPSSSAAEIFELISDKEDFLYDKMRPPRPSKPAKFRLFGNGDLRYSTPPEFGTESIADQGYTVGEEIELTLPEAVGLDGEMNYDLNPDQDLPAGEFVWDPNTRTLTGTPFEPGTYEMRYVVSDSDEDKSENDTDSLHFTITVEGACSNDANTLLDIKDELKGTGVLNWADDVHLDDWHGVDHVDGCVTELWIIGRLNGSIPAGLGKLSRLEILFLNSNDLTGSIPAALGNLRNLEVLSLNGNELTGSIPSALGNLSNLRTLHLGVNELRGSIPAALGNLRSLEFLSLNGNELTGSIPSALGNLSNLRTLHLSVNELDGSIPAALESLSNLEELDLSSNELTGSIPAALGNLHSLEMLLLDHNRLTGSIPSALGSLPNLGYFVNFSFNYLTGCIPIGLSPVDVNPQWIEPGSGVVQRLEMCGE